MIICIGADGKVAETGTYRELSKRKEGAFSKLMEWQMSGGETRSRPGREPGPTVTEEEEMEAKLEAEKEGEDVVEEEGTNVRKENLTSGEAVAERVKVGDR